MMMTVGGMLQGALASEDEAGRSLSGCRMQAELNALTLVPPAARGLELLAAAFGLPPPPPGVERAAVEAMAESVGELGPLPDARARRRALDELLRPVVVAAIAACREAADEQEQAMLALEHLRRTRAGGADRHRLGSLETCTDRLMARAAELVIVAHLRSEEAKGAARAVSLARKSRQAPRLARRPAAVRAAARDR